MKIEPGWLSIARSYIGTKELKGKQNNEKIVRMFAKVGFPQVHDDETAWCAAFVGFCLAENGLSNTHSLWALDYADFGQKLTQPLLGCIGVKKRYSNGKVVGGHVFFIVAASSNWIWALGGNQSDSVSITAIPRREVIAFRWPLGVSIPSKPLPLPTSAVGASKAGREG